MAITINSSAFKSMGKLASQASKGAKGTRKTVGTCSFSTPQILQLPI